MEVKLTEEGTFELMMDKWDIIVNLLGLGFTIAIVIMVVVAGAKMGMRFWPWVLGIALLAWIWL